MTPMNRGARVLTVLAALTLVSCATTLTPYTPDQHALKMGISKARQVVLEALRHGGADSTGNPVSLAAYTQCRVGGDGQFPSAASGRYYDIAHAAVRITMSGITITGAVYATRGLLFGGRLVVRSVVLPFKDMQIDMQPIFTTDNVVILYPKQARCYALGFADPATTTNFANALLVLKQEAVAESEPRFEAAVRAYQAAVVKPLLPEAAHRYEVQAEDAVRHNQ
ncbi:MAG: hypothetical protein ACYDDO_15075, partial [Acidiferrobacterales bacterium]